MLICLKSIHYARGSVHVYNITNSCQLQKLSDSGLIRDLSSSSYRAMQTFFTMIRLIIVSMDFHCSLVLSKDAYILVFKWLAIIVSSPDGLLLESV